MPRNGGLDSGESDSDDDGLAAGLERELGGLDSQGATIDVNDASESDFEADEKSITSEEDDDDEDYVLTTKASKPRRSRVVVDESSGSEYGGKPKRKNPPTVSGLSFVLVDDTNLIVDSAQICASRRQ